ncbi:hypothetical protein O3M35_003107 [Rhynocoris fuscipes]|uniref:Putative alpha-L-fucosidase n=1 Tax=Rhynocoris fuscipes TaxID=488301 RepID=A0AAW1CQF5_9HEMI
MLIKLLICFQREKMLIFIFLVLFNIFAPLYGGLDRYGSILSKDPPTPSPSPKPSPDWNYIDSRPLPSWYDKAKIGIFIHWGVFSVPSYTSEWFWNYWKGNPTPDLKKHKEIEKFMEKNYKPGFSYQDFAKDFTAEFYDPHRWADLFEKSGAKYVVLTSKHHEGYTMWPSNYSFSWNSMDVGPHRDIVGELRDAIASKKGLRFGLYHSLYEWFNPLYISDKKNNFSTQNFVNNKILPEMKELVLKYRPEIFWSDGEAEAPSKYWRSEEFLLWLYEESPVRKTVVVNDRWGQNTACKHGGYYTCADRYNPGSLQNHKWENAMTLDRNTWGFVRTSTLKDYLSIHELIQTMVETISYGGNILINIGPAKDGTISPIFEERLLQLGEWLNINGEAIYESQPWKFCQHDNKTSDAWYTTKDNGAILYVILLKWPENNTVYLECADITDSTKLSMLGLDEKLVASKTDKNLLKIALPDKAKVKNDWAWTIKITNPKMPQVL